MMQNTRAWMRANLTTQGYWLTDTERREPAIGLRFSTGLCLSLVVLALVLESPAMVFALSAIGLVAGFTARHPFDYLWNHGVLCLPSEMFAWWERRTAPEAPVAT
jgi:hypothetical protein